MLSSAQLNSKRNWKFGYGKANIAKLCPKKIVQISYIKTSAKCMKNSKFPTDLKLAGVTACYKKKSKTSTENCRPISTFPNASKIYERSTYDQMQQYFDNILSKYMWFLQGL